MTTAASGAPLPTTKTALTPSAIVRHLDQYVIGQDDAKRTIAVAVYSHYRNLARSTNHDIEIAKSNVLLIGPTGSGKTLLCESLARGLGVPFVTADATSLAYSKYVNEEIEAILRRLVERANGDLRRAEHGIIFIDEIDKLKTTVGLDEGNYGQRVQHALLKIMEGSRVKLDIGDIDTANILFICGGAFVGIGEITTKSHSFGFISTDDDDNQKILDRLNSRIKPTDLVEFGLIPEFTGRLPVVATFNELSQEMLVRVMTEPRNAIYAQFREILGNLGVELVIEPLVFQQIAELAHEYKSGARSLRGLFTELMSPILYAVPDQPEIRRVLIRSLFEEATMEPKLNAD
jgi:ATP-dependent Clp protease ATP-binding subunit ClpX